MAVFVACPSCGVKLNVPEDFLGKKVRCASCSTVFEATADLGRDRFGKDMPTPALGERVTAPEDIGPEYQDSDDQFDDDQRRRGRHMRRDPVPHRGGLILGLGIGSVIGGALEVGMGTCCCTLPLLSVPLGVAAWICSQGDIRQMDRGDMDPDGRGSTQTGQICGMIGCGLGALGLLCFGIRIIFLGASMWSNQRGF